jgi:hypothetical protein
MFRRTFAPEGVHAMSPDAAKKQPTTETSELQEFELEYQIRLRAYQLYETRGREDGHELADWYRAKEEITNKKFRTATA